MGKPNKIILSSFLLMLIIPLILAPPMVVAVAEYEDGEYTLPFQVLQDKNDELSATSEYMESPAILSIKDGNKLVTVTLKNSSWWQSFDILTPTGSYEAVTVVSEDQDNDTRRVAFNVHDLDKSLHAHIHIIVTGIPGFVYDNTYDIRFAFDPSHLPQLTASDNDASADEAIAPPESTPPADAETNVEPERDVEHLTEQEPESGNSSGVEPVRGDEIQDNNDAEVDNEGGRELVNNESDRDSEVDLNSEATPVDETEEQQQEHDANKVVELEQQQDEPSSNGGGRTVILLTIVGLCLLTGVILLIMRKRK